MGVVEIHDVVAGIVEMHMQICRVPARRGRVEAADRLPSDRGPLAFGDVDGERFTLVLDAACRGDLPGTGRQLELDVVDMKIRPVTGVPLARHPVGEPTLP